MDIDKLAEAIMGRIEYDRAVHKSSLVEEIRKAMKAPWSSTPPMPNMVDVAARNGEANWVSHNIKSTGQWEVWPDGRLVWTP